MTRTQPESEHETSPQITPRGPLIRIVWFTPEDGDTRRAEREITLFVADGWQIVGVGGSETAGFVVLQTGLA